MRLGPHTVLQCRVQGKSNWAQLDLHGCSVSWVCFPVMQSHTWTFAALRVTNCICAVLEALSRKWQKPKHLTGHTAPAQTGGQTLTISYHLTAISPTFWLREHPALMGVRGSVCVCVFILFFFFLKCINWLCFCFSSTESDKERERDTQLSYVCSSYVFIIFWKWCQILRQRHLCVSLLFVVTDHIPFCGTVAMESPLNLK